MEQCTVLLVLCLIPLCMANDLFCQLYDENAKSLTIYCENYRGSVPMDCTEDIYTIESTQVSEMKTIGCDEDTVLDFLNRFHRIRHLDLSHSEFKSLSWLNIKLDRLVKLVASHNELTQITADLFKKMPDISELDISYNKIQKFDVTTFRGAKHLTKIRMAHNFLNGLPTKVFGDSFQLHSIDLSSNFFTTIPTFPNNDQLNAIYLTENPITTFDCSHFTTMPFVSVYLSWEHLISFFGHMDCQGKRLQIVIQNGSNGAILPVWSGKYELHCNLNGFPNLRYFMAGANSFENVTEILPCLGESLTYLDLSSNFIGALNESTFERFIDLSRLYLRDTQLIEFNFDILQHQQYLIGLDLSHNLDLGYIESIARLQQIQLDEFNVAKCRLTNTPDMLNYLQSTIERLDLSSNFIGALNDSTFQRFIALESLNLSDTALFISNDFNPFRLLTDLNVLDISYNSLDTLNFTVLAITLNRLTEFYAADCEIANVLDVVAQFGSTIERLDLSGNQIAHFQLNATNFELLRNLQYLNLSNTNLMTIESGTFHHQSMLRSLDLSNNQLQQLDVRMISDRLERLHVDRNGLMEISNFERSRFPRLQWLAVSQNWLQAEFLQYLLNQTSDNIIEFVENPFNQRKLKPLPSTTRAIGEFLHAFYDTIKFW